MHSPTTSDAMSHKLRVLVAGAAGMVGSAVCRRLASRGCDLIPVTRRQADLLDRGQVDATMKQYPAVDCVVVAAARVGGIHANNTYPANFIFENLLIEANLIDSAYRAGIRKVVFLGSSCIYPRLAPQPMTESALLTGPLEPTNEAYAVAKIAGIKLCEAYNRQYGTDYRSLMPTNLYGPGDNFDSMNSHVIPALLRKFHDAKMRNAAFVNVWGSGRAMREFLHVDDLASAVQHFLEIPRDAFWSHVPPQESHINIGTGSEISIADLAHLIRRIVGFDGDILFDRGKPDGAPRKLLSTRRAEDLGWRASIALEQGLSDTYKWYVESLTSGS
jgi:GDP-L-fucose synthase